MSCTLSQKMANRLNALRSTGPKTAEGKARSSRNARSHGLSRAVGAVPPSEWADLIASRKSSWRSSYQPKDDAQDYLFDRLVVESVRLDQCEARIAAARIEFADRACESWDDDRRAEVAELGSKLATAPDRIQPLLLQSRHGVEWLLERWEEVAESLRVKDHWTVGNWERALDLLGLSLAARSTTTPYEIDPDDISPAPALAFIRDITDALHARLADTLTARDSRTRLDAELGLELTDPKPIRLLERYAADARRRVRWSIAELRTLQSSTPAPSAGSSPSLPDGTPGLRPNRQKPKPTKSLSTNCTPTHDEPNLSDTPARNEPNLSDTPARNEPNAPDSPTRLAPPSTAPTPRQDAPAHQSAARNEPIPPRSTPSSLPRTPLLPTSSAPVLLNRHARRARAAAAKRHHP